MKNIHTLDKREVKTKNGGIYKVSKLSDDNYTFSVSDHVTDMPQLADVMIILTKEELGELISDLQEIL